VEAGGFVVGAGSEFRFPGKFLVNSFGFRVGFGSVWRFEFQVCFREVIIEDFRFVEFGAAKFAGVQI
jgi:hypothetical protein